MNWVYILLGVSFLLHVVLFMLMRSYNKLNARRWEATSPVIDEYLAKKLAIAIENFLKAMKQKPKGL